jgi:hypothetical protein
MEKEFIPYEQTLKLKELGFDEPCFGNYKKTHKELEKSFYCYNSDYVDYNEDYIAAPLYQQAFRWFREKSKLQHMLWSGKINTVFYGYDILNIDEQKFVINNSENGGGDCDYDTYEEAELACLEKLIEIVEQKEKYD